MSKTKNAPKILREIDCPRNLRDEILQILSAGVLATAGSHFHERKSAEPTRQEVREYLKEDYFSQTGGGIDNIKLGICLRVLNIQEDRGMK